MLGNSYVIDHVISQYRREQEQRMANIYMTDCLRIIAENIAHIGGGKTISARYADIIMPKKEDKRTAGDIISAIKNKLKEGERE